MQIYYFWKKEKYVDGWDWVGLDGYHRLQVVKEHLRCEQGCINCAILPSRMGARGEHGDVFLFSNLGVSTWSSVSARWEHIKRKMHPWVQIIHLSVNKENSSKGLSKIIWRNRLFSKFQCFGWFVCIISLCDFVGHRNIMMCLEPFLPLYDHFEVWRFLVPKWQH